MKNNTKNSEKIKKNKFFQEKYEEELVNFVTDELKRRAQERKSFEQQWIINTNFVLGNHYCGVDSTGEVTDFDAQYFWQEHEVFNHIAPLFESRLAKLARVRPAMAVVPSSSDENDIKSAKVAQSIIKASTHRLNLSEKIARATKWSELCGTAFYKIVWDATSGKCVGASEDGQPIFEGDVELTVCPPFELYPDNTSCEKLQDCRSLIHARAYHIDAIKAMYGIDVQGQTLDIFSLETNGKQAGMGVYSTMPKALKTTKESHALVIEYYEMPSVNFPNGRLVIVAGDQLVYDGELPFINDENGGRTFPFVRQCSIEQASNFWGTSVIERLIPLQRAYNAVKNRKHEFMNRLSMGVLTVEDGSVDTDDLEEEGISPGKVLIYRQGSTPPMMMNHGSIPSDLSIEEERLYNDMVRISGVGDLNGNLSAFTTLSGVALQLLIEQDEAKLTSSAEQIRDAIKLSAQHILRLYKQFATNKRYLRIVGNNASVETFYFNSSDLTSEDIIFETENEMNESVAQRRSMLLDLYNKGLLHSEDGKLSNRMRAKILELLGYGIWEQGQELVELHRNKAQRENIKLKMGEGMPEVESFDDHNMHIEEHTIFLLTNQFDENKPEDYLKKQMLVAHIDSHKKALQTDAQTISVETN